MSTPRAFGVMLLAMFLALLLLPSAASTQENCLEGRAASGECVNAGLAAAMRQGSIIFSRPELSQTAQPIMPELDYKYRYPHELTTTPPSVTSTEPSSFGLPPCFPSDVTTCP
jgi:hypothetical protein